MDSKAHSVPCLDSIDIAARLEHAAIDNCAQNLARILFALLDALLKARDALLDAIRLEQRRRESIAEQLHQVDVAIDL